jgi:hypothetical protein
MRQIWKPSSQPFPNDLRVRFAASHSPTQLFGLEIERHVPSQVEVQIEKGLGVREVVHLLEQEDADHRPDGLVRPAVPLGVNIPEGLFVDEGKRARAEPARPVALQAPALALGQEAGRCQKARLCLTITYWNSPALFKLREALLLLRMQPGWFRPSDYQTEPSLAVALAEHGVTSRRPPPTPRALYPIRNCDARGSYERIRIVPGV